MSIVAKHVLLDDFGFNPLVVPIRLPVHLFLIEKDLKVGFAHKIGLLASTRYISTLLN